MIVLRCRPIGFRQLPDEIFVEHHRLDKGSFTGPIKPVRLVKVVGAYKRRKVGALFPSLTLKIRSVGEAIDKAEAKIGDQFHVGRHAQQALERWRLKDAYPANADTLGTSSMPKILNRAGDGICRGFRHRVATQVMSPSDCTIADDAEMLRSFKQALESKTRTQISTVAGVRCCGFANGTKKTRVDCGAQGRVKFNASRIVIILHLDYIFLTIPIEAIASFGASSPQRKSVTGPSCPIPSLREVVPSARQIHATPECTS